MLLSGNPLVDSLASLGDSVLGLSKVMVVTVRGVSDWLRAGIFGLAALLAMATAPRLCGQETPQQTNAKIQQLAALAAARPVDITIGSGDLLHIDVFDVPELSRDVRVGDTGEISYPLIPERVHVAGLTAFQLEKKFEDVLLEKGLVSHPQVTVFIKEQFSQPVSVVGAVNHTLVYQISHPTSLLEVLAAAGGIADTAGSVVMVTRPSPGAKSVTISANSAKDPAGDPPQVPATAPPSDPPGDTAATAPIAPPVPLSVATETGEQKITIRLQDLLESGDTVYNIPIYGGDTVTVPPAGIVYVLGFGVTVPGGYVLQGHGEQITVLKALALARGLTTFAKPDSSVIMRTNIVTGQRDLIPVHVKQIENHKSNDVTLQSNDILYIPDSIGKKALAHGATAALGIGTSLAIYRP
jgi:polysaccharide biosynthesis/export protein